MAVVKISSKQLIECMRCASRCESPKCDDPAIKVVNRGPAELLDGGSGRRPLQMPPRRVPRLSADAVRRSAPACCGILVVELRGTRCHTSYRRVPAYTQFTFEPGRVYRTPAGSDVALLPD